MDHELILIQLTNYRHSIKYSINYFKSNQTTLKQETPKSNHHQSRTKSKSNKDKT